MKAAAVVVIALLLVGLGLGSKAVSVRNDLVTQKNAIDGAWAQVDNVLKRRADLIPNLVETVKGFASQEKEILNNLANARSAMAGARTPQEAMQANAQVEGALGRLLVVVENYPQLKSNEQFARLQDELSGSENRIAVERRKYNELIQTYNTSIELFPNNLFAGFFGFARNDNYFKTEPAQREVPKVKF